MTDTNQTSLATGGMSREGTTTVVKINQPKIDSYDKAALCAPICKCKDTPGVGKDGRSLKQSCVSNALKSADKAADHKSPYKPEVNYDMTKDPPAPIMDSTIETKGHDWLPGWIKKYWDPESPYLAGRGLVRRPDVVVVKDASKPPTQDNIKQVVEIKFPPDSMDVRQEKAYSDIAGSRDKLEVLGPDDCDCSKPKPDPAKVPVPDAQSLTAGAVLTTLFLGLLAF